MNESHGPDQDTLAGILTRLVRAVAEDIDVIDLLDGLTTECVSLFAVRAAGLLLGDRSGALHVVASSDERPELVGLLDMQTVQGPCRDCVTTGAAVAAPDLSDPDAGRRWPGFTAEALQQGVRAVHALPMRLPSRAVGALNLLDADPRDLGPADLRAAQTLADAATVGILAERHARDSAVVVEQLRATIAGRVVIEQAKGMIAERGNLEVADAFARLRGHAHHTSRHLTDLARDVLDGTVDTAVVLLTVPDDR